KYPWLASVTEVAANSLEDNSPLECKESLLPGRRPGVLLQILVEEVVLGFSRFQTGTRIIPAQEQAAVMEEAERLQSTISAIAARLEEELMETQLSILFILAAAAEALSQSMAETVEVQSQLQQGILNLAGACMLTEVQMVTVAEVAAPSS